MGNTASVPAKLMLVPASMRMRAWVLPPVVTPVLGSASAVTVNTPLGAVMVPPCRSTSSPSILMVDCNCACAATAVAVSVYSGKMLMSLLLPMVSVPPCEAERGVVPWTTA